MVILKSRGQGQTKIWRTNGQICPVLSTRIWTLSPGLENNHTNKCWSGILPTILTYIILLENCQNNISVYGCSPIQGKIFYSCWNLMKPGSESGTYTLFLFPVKDIMISDNFYKTQNFLRTPWASVIMHKDLLHLIIWM